MLIEDHALIGDTETAALVTPDGTIDWLCLPRFDGGACFAALLGDHDNGSWRITPQVEVTAFRRRYVPSTLVLETTLETAAGTVRLIDFMPPRGFDTEHSIPDVVRIVEGVTGTVPVRMELTVRFDYGSVVPWVTYDDDADCHRFVAGPDALRLETPVPVHGEDLRSVAEFDVRPGDRVPFVLSWHSSHGEEPDPLDAEEAYDETVAWWSSWCDRSTYGGGWTEEVERSLITLKALTYGPTGAILAAPTTSLPETIGGERNWDYRFTWLRDATFTLSALLLSGHREEAVAWRRWLLRAVAGDPRDLQIMYGVGGERRLTEIELGWLPGYEDSRPVRVGNAAHAQTQLDVYGELLDVLHLALRAGIDVEPEVWELQKVLLQHLETIWREPDDGLWEFRGEPRHFTHSKLMAWVAFDRASATVELCGVDGPVDRWRRIAAEIHAEVCERGFDAERNTFTQYYGSETLDAALLLIPQMGFLPTDDPRVVGTVEAIQRELTVDGAFVRRYDSGTNGLAGEEGAFLFCSFWLVDALAMIGRRGEARELFQRLLELRNDVGLLAEEYDPVAGRQLGNFPQAFSHVGLVNSAANLSELDSAPASARPSAHPAREG